MPPSVNPVQTTTTTTMVTLCRFAPSAAIEPLANTMGRQVVMVAKDFLDGACARITCTRADFHVIVSSTKTNAINVDIVD